MKKVFKTMTLALAMLGLFLLVSCSKITQSYADKVNKAAESGEALTVEQIKKDLGDSAIDLTSFGGNMIIAIKGCKSMKEYQDLMEDVQKNPDKKVSTIMITIENGKAVKAEYYSGPAIDME